MLEESEVTQADLIHNKRPMDRRIGYIIVALIGALLFYVAIGYSGWFCGESILGSRCLNSELARVTGGLLITAALLITFAAVFLIIEYIKGARWANIVAVVFTLISAILAIAGVFYYIDNTGFWSPFIAAMGMSFTIALAAILLMDIISK